MPCNTVDRTGLPGGRERDPVGDHERGRGCARRDRAGDHRRGPVDRREHGHLVAADPLSRTWPLNRRSTRIQQWLLPITVAVAIGGVIAAGARMALTRRANPLLDVTGGLLTIAAASTLGGHGHDAAAQGRGCLVGVGAAGLHRRALHPAAAPGC